MGSFPLHLRAAQHPLAGLARTSFNCRGWSSAAESAGDSPHGAFPCRSPEETSPPPQPRPRLPSRALRRRPQNPMSVSVAMQTKIIFRSSISATWTTTLSTIFSFSRTRETMARRSEKANLAGSSCPNPPPWHCQGAFCYRRHGNT